MVNNVLVTGGAGYIGSHTSLQLIEAGNQVVVLDNLYSGHEWAIAKGANFVRGEIHDQELVSNIIKTHNIDSVIHFAGYVVVPESVKDPAKYYQNNVVGSLNLIDCCVKNQVNQLIFSSSAAVYGIPDQCPVVEQSLLNPINPYGTTKLITEWNLRDFAEANKDQFRFVALRYFNVAGAHMGGLIGQATPQATHLIKVACEVAWGLKPSLFVFGTDYDTADGTCIRDYIHVDDLAAAHIDALSYLNGGNQSNIFNCGYGEGFSVNQVVECLKQVSKVDFDVQYAPRRDGDPPELVADNTKIMQQLNWKPKYNDLQTICRSAYEWEGKFLGRS